MITAMQDPNARMPCVLVSRRMLHDATARSVVTGGTRCRRTSSADYAKPGGTTTLLVTACDDRARQGPADQRRAGFPAYMTSLFSASAQAVATWRFGSAVLPGIVAQPLFPT